MPGKFDSHRRPPLLGHRRNGLPLAMLGVFALAPGAKAFGLEQTTVSAAHIIAADALPALARRVLAVSPTSAPTASAQGLVSQDRSALDLTRLSMSAFGDADER